MKTAGTNGQAMFAQDNVRVTKGIKYTISGWFYVASGKPSIQIGNGTVGYTNSGAFSPTLRQWTQLSWTFTTPDSSINVYFGFQSAYNPAGTALELVFTGVKLEKGEVKTDWTPAPEDQATQSQITQLANDINLRVKKGDVINQINISTEGI
ncbi:hypothetical protein CWO92_24880, partial [Heyndrickxia camelliae]